MKRTSLAAITALVAPSAAAQATVSYLSTGWKDFGTTNITGLTGNFLPGWTSLTASPDLGDDVFFVPTQSLSGAPGDAALWMLNYDPGSIGAPANESVRLSLDGFTIGDTYELSFWATIVTNSFAGWVGNNDALSVDIAGADIASYLTPILSDPTDADGLNPWTPISITFTALSTNVQFDFGATPIGLDPAGTATRFGIDGLDARVVPTPASAALVGMGGLLAIRRRR
ncbi:MAG: hypothetical protein KDA31_12250 [Phycisphaerales bacterium]|nr:hypothetical protein [Phycisphaerales bacterium]